MDAECRQLEIEASREMGCTEACMVRVEWMAEPECYRFSHPVWGGDDRERVSVYVAAGVIEDHKAAVQLVAARLRQVISAEREWQWERPTF